MSSTGPSIRAVCRILNQSSCGSGSICGITEDGKSLIMTNAHVAGSQIGRVVNVEVESQGGERIQARVIKAAFSSRTLADWAVLETVQPYNKVTPVFLSKNRPSRGSHYTKGFPRCRPHNGTNITTVDMSNNTPLWRWNPNAISGQSGSGVWSDEDNLQYGLLTWSWGGRGAGQMTSEMYKQARDRTTAGAPRPDNLIDLTDVGDFKLNDEDRGSDDPILHEGFFEQSSLTELPIWAEDNPGGGEPDPEPDQPGQQVNGVSKKVFLEHLRRQSEFFEAERRRLAQEIPDAQSGFFSIFNN